MEQIYIYIFWRKGSIDLKIWRTTSFRMYLYRDVIKLTWSSQWILVCDDYQGHRHDEFQKVHLSKNLLPAETLMLGQCIEPRHVEKVPGDTEKPGSASLLSLQFTRLIRTLMEFSSALRKLRTDDDYAPFPCIWVWTRCCA